MMSNGVVCNAVKCFAVICDLVKCNVVTCDMVVKWTAGKCCVGRTKAQKSIMHAAWLLHHFLEPGKDRSAED